MLTQSFEEKEKVWGLLLWCSLLRIWCCHCGSWSCCCGTGMILSPGTANMLWIWQKNKKCEQKGKKIRTGRPGGKQNLEKCERLEEQVLQRPSVGFMFYAMQGLERLLLTCPPLYQNLSS